MDGERTISIKDQMRQVTSELVGVVRRTRRIQIQQGPLSRPNWP